MKTKKDADWNPEAVPSFWINHASRILMRRFEQRLRPLDFGMAYVPVVLALEEDGALLQKDLAERAHVEQPTMAALLARMERDGLVAREPHPTDKRASQIRLTAKARSRLPQAKEVLREEAAKVTTDFSEKERETFLKLLRRAVQNLDASEE